MAANRTGGIEWLFLAILMGVLGTLLKHLVVAAQHLAARLP